MQSFKTEVAFKKFLSKISEEKVIFKNNKDENNFINNPY